MGKKSSIFDSHYALLMERFPKLALVMQSFSFAVKKKEEIGPIDFKEIEALYVYGIGRGEGYFQAKDWLFRKPSHRLIFLEDEVKEFAQFLHSSDAAEILTSLQVIFSLSDEIGALAEQFPSSCVEIVALPSKSKRRFKAIKEEIFRKTALANGSHIDRLHGYQPFHNFVQNLHHLPRSFYANQLQNQFRGCPAIVCGAGPSLKKAIPLLRTLENKALLIAGGSTLAALSSTGIMPHFGMAVDPNLEEYRRLKNSFAFAVPLLYSTRVFPAIFQTTNGPFGYMRSGIGGVMELWMEEELGLKEPFIGMNLSSESISVTTICLAWAQFLGCSPILLSGVDLAYTENQRYTAGVMNESDADFLADKSAADRIFQRKDRRGKRVHTAVRWLIESSAFSHFASMHPETTFINVTEGGIGFKEIPYRPFEEVISSFEAKGSLRSMVQKAVLSAPMPSRTGVLIDEKMKALSESLDRIIEHLEICTGMKEGSSALAQIELVEEMAYSYLFYDVFSVLEKELERSVGPEHREKEKWMRFLKLAKCYRAMLE